MAIPMWQQILNRGQQTLAVWQLHAPAFALRNLTLASHTADVAALAPAGQATEDAQEGLDDAREDRDAALGVVAATNTRLPRKLDGELLPDDPFHADLEDIRRVASVSGPATLERGQKVVALWKKLNARNAAASPVIPPVTVGGVTLADFTAQVESLSAKGQTVQDKEAALRDLRGDLRTLAASVDQNNKRWFAGWEGEFAPGSPEREALAQIDTGSGSGGGGQPTPGGGGNPPVG